MTSTAEQRAATSGRGEGFSRILVASDGSADARLAVAAAIDLAGRAGATLDVVNAWAVRTWPYGIYGADGSGFAAVVESAEVDSRALVEAVAVDAKAAGVQVGELRVFRQPAAEATIAAAAEIGDDLIVVGSRGLGPVRRLLLGSVSDAIVHHARRAVLVMRGGHQAWPPRLVIGADDGDDATWAALRRAADLARLVEARFELVEVVPPMARFSHISEQEALIDVEAHLGSRAGRLADRLGSYPGTDVRTGDPATELLEVSNSREGCLLVAGSHGRSTLNRLRLGSVSTNLVHAAECPVMVVPAAAPTERRESSS